MATFIQTLSLRTRLRAALVLMLAVLVAVLLLLADSIIERGFLVVEEREVAERVTQVTNALENGLLGLQRTTIDYAQWDDTYAFVGDEDPAFIETNFVDSTFIYNALACVIMVNAEGDIVYAAWFDLAEETFVDPPPELTSFTGPYATLLQHRSVDAGIKGFLLLEDGPLLLAAQPIVTSLGEGPPAGTLLMGRWLDEAEVARLAELTRLDFAVYQPDAAALPDELQPLAAGATAEKPFIQIVDAQRILGATLLPNLSGTAGIVVALDLPRDVYQLGQTALRNYTLVLLATALLFGALVLVVIERTVLRRTIRLSQQVAAIGPHAPTVRVEALGRDEVGQLAAAINQMLQRLAAYQTQVAENERRYRQLIELLPDAIIVHDGRTVRYINSVGARMLGNGLPATLIGQPVAPVVGGLTPRPDGTPVIQEAALRCANGETIEAELVALPFSDHDTPATQVIVRNITERKQVEQTLRAAKEAADAANRAKSQFLATMSHELRTPLTAIIGYAELLEQSLDVAEPTEMRQDLGRIRNAGVHLLALINDVLDLSKIEAGHMQTKPSTLNVSQLLETVVATVRPLAQNNGNQLLVQHDIGLGEMFTDAMRLRQMLLNLLSNACKFTHEGRVTLEVRVLPAEAPDVPERLTFAVHDTGIGIAPDQIQRLFQDFVQIDASSTRKYGGTGLGLALSQRLAQLLGGAITVTSEPEVGSTFTLTVPRQTTTLGEAAPLVPLVPTALAPPSLGDLPGGESRIILIIDDDPAIRDLLPRVLAQTGLHFEAAASGEEGLDLAAALLPDLILLDVLLPGMTGWDVLQQLKSDPDTEAIPVLMLTIAQDTANGFMLGATNILSKPVEVERLATEVALVLHGQPTAQRLLLVEDDPDIRAYLRRTLVQGGWSVDEAEDGPTALKLLEQQAPALAIVDLMLPGMDGITLIAAMRTHPHGAELPILVVTAKDLALAEQEQLNQSVEQVMRKGSFRGDELLRSVRALLQRRTER
ncbi:MAG: response regulator [Candidatus Viridilinea halotolerans]|uniref:Circadian input-output histidine kinase CikA n=1 Tax=Candidatus Viridilinea halotolerans TaxID=2491704 RepID=A0A426U237_9CHLR|nr:MAG: response regulator [Candidatus Viridilinea halotolerans]